MHIEQAANRNSPPAVLLRQSYRINGKVGKRTLANLSKLPDETIEGLLHSAQGWASSKKPRRCVWNYSLESPVAPARRAQPALNKTRSKQNQDRFPVHSVATLLADLGTIVKNKVRANGNQPLKKVRLRGLFLLVSLYPTKLWVDRSAKMATWLGRAQLYLIQLNKLVYFK